MTSTTKKRRDPDDGLFEGQFRELNESFYNSRPFSYLRQRLAGLLLVIADPPIAPDRLQSPITIGELTVGGIGALRPPDETVLDYAAMESVVLLHHASEAMFRLFFAHNKEPACPWLEASRVVLGGGFKREVEQLLKNLDAPDVTSDVLKVFRGNDSYEMAAARDFSGSAEQWRAQVDGLLALLHLVGRRLLDEGRLYNAAKHGLAVRSAQIGIQLGDGQPLLKVDGPSLSILDVNTQSRRWEQAVTWVHVDATIAQTILVINEIEAMFKIGRLRYLGEPSDGGLPLVTPEVLKQLQTRSALSRAAADSEGAVLAVSTMREELTYYAEAEPPT